MSSGPKYKDYEDQAKREKSFLNYPKTYPRKEDLVRAGFFYLGPGSGNDDDCQCYYCGVRLFNWTRDDDPVKEHQKFRPNCLVIQTLQNPTSNAPPANMFPPENTSFNTKIENKIHNTQIIYQPQSGTTISNMYPKRNDLSHTVSKQQQYSFVQNTVTVTSGLTKRQHYPIRQSSKELESTQMETTVTNKLLNYSSPHYYNQQQAPPTNPTTFPTRISFDNPNQQIPNPNNHIYSSYQPRASGRIDNNLLTGQLPPREPMYSSPHQYYPIQATIQPPQAMSTQTVYGNQPQLGYTSAADRYPLNRASVEQQNFQFAPTMSSVPHQSFSFGNSTNSGISEQGLEPHPILPSNGNIIASNPLQQTSHIHSVQTQYVPNSLTHQPQASRFPNQLPLETPQNPQFYPQNPQFYPQNAQFYPQNTKEDYHT